MHLLADGRGLPLAAEVSGGQESELRYAPGVLERVRIAQPRGRARTRPRAVAGDRGYSYRVMRQYLRARHIRAVIPERRDQIAHRRGRPPTLDRRAYRRRNAIERCVGWLKERRRLATRFEKLAVHYLGVLKLAMIEKHLQVALSNTP